MKSPLSFARSFTNQSVVSKCAVPVLFLIVSISLATAEEQLDLPQGWKSDPAHPEIDLRVSAIRKYSAAKQAIRANYQSALAGIIAHANRVEVFLLDFELLEDEEIAKIKEEGRFPIRPYDATTRILKRLTLKGDAIAAAKENFQNLLKKEGQGSGAACHFPIHGIRFFKDDELLFETSICWQCANYYISYPDDLKATWVGLFDEKLKEFLMQQMPVPKKELDRFEAKYPKKQR
jgi:hypothetical protein